ncbi:MAG: DUF3696 domain-containing protein [Candidatus Hydrogenedentes bacterium]|nr:DUF3696 domain-containing protein [Candidatus Hydrogenedentota bacterium]
MKHDPVRISGIAVRGFKALRDEKRIDIKPLTILAGANSSGKSSIMQPLLLLKQTLEAPNDPGALLLDGPCVRFTSMEQLLSKCPTTDKVRRFSVRLDLSNGRSLETVYRAKQKEGFEVERLTYVTSRKKTVIKPGMTHTQIMAVVPSPFNNQPKYYDKGRETELTWHIVRDRCFLSFGLYMMEYGKVRPFSYMTEISPGLDFIPIIKSIIHLPGLRGNPQRNYSKNAVAPVFPGTFENYVASLVTHWQSNDKDKLKELGRLLEHLGLSWKVDAKAIDDTQVELRVGRLPCGKRGGANDLVSIADVGVGISQVLPVLVALVAGEPGQLVYIEQPEIHLHPRAQRRLAHALCEAAKRGVVLVVETHSALLLREVQTLVALGQMPKEDVSLQWFQRNEEGETVISTATLDENGAYGDWPEDFDETELDAEQAYLDAVERREAGG